MKPVHCCASLDGLTDEGTKTVALPFRSGERTLQLTSVALRIGLCTKTSNKAEGAAASRKSYMPHWQRDQIRKLVARVEAVISDPSSGAAKTVCLLQVPVRLPASDDENEQQLAIGGSGSAKLDLRFQMESVQFSVKLSRVGRWDGPLSGVEGNVTISGVESDLAAAA